MLYIFLLSFRLLDFTPPKPRLFLRQKLKPWTCWWETPNSDILLIYLSIHELVIIFKKCINQSIYNIYVLFNIICHQHLYIHPYFFMSHSHNIVSLNSCYDILIFFMKEKNLCPSSNNFHLKITLIFFVLVSISLIDTSSLARLSKSFRLFALTFASLLLVLKA